MDIESIFKKYKDNQESEQQLFLLEGNRIVVGEEVDGDNRLFYVIRDGESYILEPAWNQVIIQSSIKPKTKSVSRSSSG